jgi:hypothetical protein
LRNLTTNCAATPTVPFASGSRHLPLHRDVAGHPNHHTLQFFADGKADGRYVTAELPLLPFEDRSFDLAICSHFLFLYSQQLGEAFHHTAIKELCRIAKEVRIFPLLALGGIGYSYVSPIAHSFRQLGYTVSIERVPYEFQRGANKMMRIVTAK